jgi:hypothetical protein
MRLRRKLQRLRSAVAALAPERGAQGRNPPDRGFSK